jgi:HEAT repeat protein
VLGYLGANCRTAAFDSRWHDYWHRTWGARGLLYVWSDSATAPVVAGLSDEHWRPTEMCLKVAARREIGEAGPGAIHLVTHELPRVRAAALRCLSKVGDAEHVDMVEAARDDPDAQVRRAAHRALLEMVERLDLEPSR